MSLDAGFNPLHLAARNGHISCVRLFTKHRANLDVAGAHGFTSLHLAAMRGHKVRRCRLTSG